MLVYCILWRAHWGDTANWLCNIAHITHRGDVLLLVSQRDLSRQKGYQCSGEIGNITYDWHRYVDFVISWTFKFNENISLKSELNVYWALCWYSSVVLLPVFPRSAILHKSAVNDTAKCNGTSCNLCNVACVFMRHEPRHIRNHTF